MPRIPISTPLTALGLAVEVAGMPKGGFVSNRLVLYDDCIATCDAGEFEGAVLYRCAVAPFARPRAILIDPRRYTTINAWFNDNIEALAGVMHWAFSQLDNAADRVDLHGVDLEMVARTLGGDVSHLDLSSTHYCPTRTLTHVKLRHVTLADADLQGATFEQWDFFDVDFRGANLAGATFISCTFEKVNFANADLSGATFVACKDLGTPLDLTAANTRHLMLLSPNATLTPAQDKLVYRHRERSEAIKQDLQPFALRLARFYTYVRDRANVFEGLDLRGATLGRGFSNFTNMSFRGCNLSGIHTEVLTFDKCDLTGADLSGIHARALGFTRSAVRDVNLSEMNIEVGISIHTCEVRDVRLDTTHASEMGIRGSSLTNVSLRNVAFQTLTISPTYSHEMDVDSRVPDPDRPLELFTQRIDSADALVPLSALPNNDGRQIICVFDNVDFENADIADVRASGLAARDVRGDDPELLSRLRRASTIPFPEA